MSITVVHNEFICIIYVRVLMYLSLFISSNWHLFLIKSYQTLYQLWLIIPFVNRIVGKYKYSEFCPNRPPICSVNTGILSKSVLLIRPEFPPPFDITVNSSVYTGFCLLWKTGRISWSQRYIWHCPNRIYWFFIDVFQHRPTGRCLPVNWCHHTL